jgi:hypothetical protein
MDDNAMSDAIPPGALVAGPGFPRMALGLAWFGSSLGTGILGWLVGGLPGRLLLGAAVLGFVATAAVVSNRRRRVTLVFSALAGAVVVAVGVVAAVLAVTLGDRGVAAAVAIAAVPVAGGLLSQRLSRRSRRMAEPR